MSDFSRSFAVVIDAPVHTVFEYCRDPRRIFAGDPQLHVSDVALTPNGVGTRWRIVTTVAKGVVTEEDRNEYVEFVPDQRIAMKSYPKLTVARMTKQVMHGPSWTWTFAPANGGTKLTVTFLEEDAPWWQRAFDVAMEKTWSKSIRDWLAVVKTGAEAQAAAAR